MPTVPLDQIQGAPEDTAHHVKQPLQGSFLVISRKKQCWHLGNRLKSKLDSCMACADSLEKWGGEVEANRPLGSEEWAGGWLGDRRGKTGTKKRCLMVFVYAHHNI